VIHFAKSVNPGCAVLMMTAFASLESAIEAMKLGAFDYVAKRSDRGTQAKLDRWCSISRA